MTFVPSRLLVALTLGPLGLAIATTFDESLLRPLLVLDGVLVAIAVLDALLALGTSVKVTRTVRPVLSIGRYNAVDLRLQSRSKRALTVDVMDDLPEHVRGEGLPARAVLPARGSATVSYRVRPDRRGAYELGAHTIRYRTPLGLWLRQVRIAATDEVHVYPDLEAVRDFDLLARQDRSHAMFRAIRRPGGQSEFERLREYSRDDEYRSIDWKATARRDKLIARQYQLERNQTIELVLDAGRLLTVDTQGLPLFDHALNAALMLAHVAARGGDRVGLVAFSDRVRASIRPTAGPAATRRLVRATYDLHPEMVESDYEAALGYVGHALRQRSLVVVFTRVTDHVSADALVRYTRGLLPKHLPLIILLRDPEVESLAHLQETDDDATLYLRAAAAEVLAGRDQLVRRLRNQGANVLEVDPKALTPALVNRYLEIKVRHRL